jgi:hypothetical protein
MTVSHATYCIIDSDGELPEGIVGLHGGAVSNLPYRGIGVAVSLLTRPVQDIVAGAVEHEAVVERLMQTHTVLPMRFPTVFTSQEAVLAMMSQHHDSFREGLQRLHHQVEFGVKVLWPRGEGVPSTGSGQALPALRRHGVPNAESCVGEPQDARVTKEQGRDARATMSGRQYIQERYRRYQDRQALGEQAAQFGHGLDAALSTLATAKRLRKVVANAFAFDGVYLVDKDKGADFRRAFAEARRSEPGFYYLLSGPWPPYHFVTG